MLYSCTRMATVGVKRLIPPLDAVYLTDVRYTAEEIKRKLRRDSDRKQKTTRRVKCVGGRAAMMNGRTQLVLRNAT